VTVNSSAADHQNKIWRLCNHLEATTLRPLKLPCLSSPFLTFPHLSSPYHTLSSFLALSRPLKLPRLITPSQASSPFLALSRLITPSQAFSPFLTFPRPSRCSSTRKTPMAYNSNAGLHQIFKIDKLARLVVTVIGREGAVSLACTCRDLEESVLSTLWAEQDSLRTLLQVLPKPMLVQEDVRCGKHLVRWPSLCLDVSNISV